MQTRTVWQLGSNDPNNANAFDTISTWWSSTNAQDVTWKQRLIESNQEPDQLNWDLQRFDETFLINEAEIRGITLYWQKFGENEERSTTPKKLVLDQVHQCLYIFPQSQEGIVIQVGIKKVVYQTVELKLPTLSYVGFDNGGVLTLKDDSQQLEVKVLMRNEQIEELKHLLNP